MRTRTESPMTVGRFAPSPSGSLHVGNLRTAMLTWLVARSSAGQVLLRIEDLDPQSSRAELISEHQHDLARLGLHFDGPVIHQSERHALYDEAIAVLHSAGLLYPCYCSRREIAEATRAPHGDSAFVYPGTCRELTIGQRAERESEGRRPAWRARALEGDVTAHDMVLGSQRAAIDDFVVRRQDGVAAYNLAVVVDDGLQGVTQVVRGDDLWPTTPRQVWLAQILGHDVPLYVHVPLVVGPDGERLAKRHGAVTLHDIEAGGGSVSRLRTALARSVGCEVGDEASIESVLQAFALDRLPRTPWTFDANAW